MWHETDQFWTISDYFPQPRAVNAIDSGSEHDRDHVYASATISQRFSHTVYAGIGHQLTPFESVVFSLAPTVYATSPNASLGCASLSRILFFRYLQ
jgi:hypothetical protein